MREIWKLGLAGLFASQMVLAHAAVSGMKFISTPGDYIGGGTTQTYKAPSATVTASGSTAPTAKLAADDSAA